MKAPTVNTGGKMGQILDHLLCASDPKIRYQDAKDALKLHNALLKLVDEAPHTKQCTHGLVLESLRGKRIEVGCDCWKSRVVR